MKFTPGWEVEFPLIENRINRNGCIEILQRNNLPIPPKSSCFFCPAMRLSEVRSLKNSSPFFYKKAIKLERNAVLKSKKIRGLGINYKWEDAMKQGVFGKTQ